MNKKYYSSVSSKDFVGLKNFDEENCYQKLEDTSIYKNADLETKTNIENFEKQGFLILKNYLSPAEADAANEIIDSLLKSKKVKFKYGNKIMFAIHQSTLLQAFGDNANLIELLSSLIKGKAELFQSINFLMGSEQRTHSDSIHMTTYPLGGLLGVWIALEDIDDDNGPLHYYAGSNHLPYYLNSDYNNEGSKFLIGDKDYTEYEKMMASKILEHKINKSIFKAKKGDLFVWHANLLHGGEPHVNKQKTRKSMVLHYYNQNSVCYHEITQRPALIKRR